MYIQYIHVIEHVDIYLFNYIYIFNSPDFVGNMGIYIHVYVSCTFLTFNLLHMCRT